MFARAGLSVRVRIRAPVSTLHVSAEWEDLDMTGDEVQGAIARVDGELSLLVDEEGLVLAGDRESVDGYVAHIRSFVGEASDVVDLSPRAAPRTRQRLRPESATLPFRPESSSDCRRRV